MGLLKINYKHMKTRTIILVLFLLICNFSFAQKEFEVEYTPTNELKLYYDDYFIEFEFAVEEKVEIEISEGLFYYWYKENKINRSQGGYGGKLLHGIFTVFFQSGKLKEKGEFKYGLKEGKWKKWYENGNLLQVSNWEHGSLINEWMEYDENGLITTQANYNKGLLDGDYKEFINGELVEKKKYRKGKETRHSTLNQTNDTVKGQNELDDVQTQDNEKDE